MEAEPTVRLDIDGAIATVTMYNPRRKNAVTARMFDALRAHCVAIDAARDVRCVVLTGEGGDFCAGADLSARAEPRGDEAAPRGDDAAPRSAPTSASTLAVMQRIGAAVSALASLTQPVVAKVRGVAVGAGLGLALGCDLVVASDDARFGAVFVRRGLSLDSGASWLLPRLVGMQRAMELTLLGDIVDATEAQRIGLVNRVVASNELDDAVDALTSRLAMGPPIAMAQSKRLLRQAFSMSLDDILAAEAAAQAVNSATHDTAEGMRAFLERREPRFEGR